MVLQGSNHAQSCKQHFRIFKFQDLCLLKISENGLIWYGQHTKSWLRIKIIQRTTLCVHEKINNYTVINNGYHWIFASDSCDQKSKRILNNPKLLYVSQYTQNSAPRIWRNKLNKIQSAKSRKFHTNVRSHVSFEKRLVVDSFHKISKT